MTTTKINSIYLIGSLRNENVPTLGNRIRDIGIEAFDQWHGAGPEADDYWQKYSKFKGLTYKEALQDHGAKHVFEFDKKHLDRCDAAVLVMPAGKSGHLELGYMAGKGKPTFVVFEEEPDRWDVMYQFCTGIYFNWEDFLAELSRTSKDNISSIQRPVNQMWGRCVEAGRNDSFYGV